MANNYTTSQPTTVEFSGDSVAAGTMPGTYDIIITANPGYTVQASDFTIGSTLPVEVASVNFSDTTTALDPSNQVIARVNLLALFLTLILVVIVFRIILLGLLVLDLARI